MKYLLALLLASSASAGGIVQGGAASGASSINAPCTTAECILGPLNIDGTTPSVTVTSSMTVTGAGGLGVTYGVTAGSVTAGAITINAAASGIIDAVNTDLYLRRNGSPGNIIFSPNNAAETVRFQANGNVGIGTASPATTLEVRGGTDGDTAELARVGTSATHTGGIGINANGAGYATSIFNAGGIQATFISSGLALGSYSGANNPPANSLIVSGNVGIGTASPASKLHISSGTITIDGTGSPTTSQALCLATGGALGHCTSVVGAGGGCTCVSP